MSGETAQSESGWTIDTLKEFHDRELVHERELREMQKVSSDLALQLQHANNERHFTALNGEQARIANVLASTIPREVFEGYREERYKSDKIIAQTMAEEKGARGQTTRWMTVALFIVAVTGLLLKFVPIQAVGQ